MGAKLHLLTAGKIDLMSGGGNFSTGLLFGQTARRTDLRHLSFQVWWICLISLMAEFPLQLCPKDSCCQRAKSKDPGGIFQLRFMFCPVIGRTINSSTELSRTSSLTIQRLWLQTRVAPRDLLTVRSPLVQDPLQKTPLQGVIFHPKVVFLWVRKTSNYIHGAWLLFSRWISGARSALQIQYCPFQTFPMGWGSRSSATATCDFLATPCQTEPRAESQCMPPETKGWERKIWSTLWPPFTRASTACKTTVTPSSLRNPPAGKGWVSRAGVLLCRRLCWCAQLQRGRETGCLGENSNLWKEPEQSVIRGTESPCL